MHLRSCSKSQAIISVGTCNNVLFINFPYSEKTGVGQLIFKKEKTVENNSLMPPIYIVTSLTKTKKCMHYCCLKVFFSSNNSHLMSQVIVMIITLDHSVTGKEKSKSITSQIRRSRF